MKSLKCVNHDYIEIRTITCDGCSKPICGKCLKKKNDKEIMQSLLYKSKLLKKQLRGPKKIKLLMRRKKLLSHTKSFDIDPSRLQSLIQNAQEKNSCSQEKQRLLKRKNRKKKGRKKFIAAGIKE